MFYRIVVKEGSTLILTKKTKAGRTHHLLKEGQHDFRARRSPHGDGRRWLVLTGSSSIGASMDDIRQQGFEPKKIA